MPGEVTGPARRTAVEVGRPVRDVGESAGTFRGRDVAARTVAAHGRSLRHDTATAARRGSAAGLLARAVSTFRGSFRASAAVRQGAAAPVPGASTSRPAVVSADAAARDVATGHISWLGNRLVNAAGDGAVTPAQRDELTKVIGLAGGVDKDIVRAAELLDKSASVPLAADEQRELNSLVASNRHNLVLLQGWLAQRTADLAEQGSLTPAAKELYDMLQTRFADRLMDLADLICLHDLEEPPDEPVSRSARAGACLLDADAALDVARDLDVPGLSAAAKQSLVADLEAHRDRLAEVRDVAGGGSVRPPTAELRLASRELWDAPLPLVKPGKASAEGIRQLKARWAAGGASPLPLAHADVGQARMLREFIEYRLAEAGVARRDMPELVQALGDARNRAINAQPWDPIERRVSTELPDGTAVAADSRIVPARAMASHFATDYAGNGINCSDRTQYAHVPNLAQTSVTNADGEVLFAGLRHGVIDPYDIDAKYLARLPEARLREMVGDLLVRDADGADRARRIGELVDGIRGDPAQAASAATAMRVQASRDMARELATAALVSDPAKFERACAGETVDVQLSSISLLTPDRLRHAFGKAGSDERTMLGHQAAALDDLASGGPVTLSVRDATGQQRNVTANIDVRQFNFGVNAGAVQGFRAGPVSVPARAPGVRHLMGWGFAMARNDRHLERLVGPPDSDTIGGDVEERVVSMLRTANRLRDEHTFLRAGQDASRLPPLRRAQAARLAAEIEAVEKRALTLSQAGAQLKQVWADRSYRHGGGDPYKMVSRLALVSHLMGETPLFNCKSGKDRTGQLDAEVKFLATAADAGDGRLPGVDTDMARWRAARSDFTLNTGNLEMQQLNTGLPGYKLAGVSGLSNMVADGLKPVYRGGSAYVAS